MDKNTDAYKDAASVTLSDISRSLLRIENILKMGTPYLLTEEAVDAFKKHIGTNHRCPENFNYLLRIFGSFFHSRNVAELTPAEIEGFISSTWGSNKPSTMAKRADQLSAFFSFCDRLLKRSGSSGFTNPCSLIERVKVVAEARRGFIGPEKMQGLLVTCDDPKHWLIFAILITAGLRVSELLKLRPVDVDGRVLTLVYPKSGKEKEYAVVPKTVAGRLQEHISHISPKEAIFPTTRGAIHRLVKRHGCKTGLELTTHDFRRWTATFWERHGELAMMRFILRHSRIRDGSGMTVMEPLTARYISVLSVQEAMERQDKVMAPALGL